MILSGMGRDGASGMAAMHEAGCTTLAQDEASCVVHGMPGAALKMGAVTHIVALESMSEVLVHLASRRRSR